jgi:hypothetical protein
MEMSVGISLTEGLIPKHFNYIILAHTSTKFFTVENEFFGVKNYETF